RLLCTQGLIVEAKSLHDAGSEVFHDGVGPADQSLYEIDRFSASQVQRDTLFVRIQQDEHERAVKTRARRCLQQPQKVRSLAGFHSNDHSTLLREVAGGHRPSRPGTKFEDLRPGEDTCLGSRISAEFRGRPGPGASRRAQEPLLQNLGLVLAQAWCSPPNAQLVRTRTHKESRVLHPAASIRDLELREEAPRAKLWVVKQFASVVARREEDSPAQRFGVELTHGFGAKERPKCLLETYELLIRERPRVVSGPVHRAKPFRSHSAFGHARHCGGEICRACRASAQPERDEAILRRPDFPRSPGAGACTAREPTV